MKTYLLEGFCQIGGNRIVSAKSPSPSRMLDRCELINHALTRYVLTISEPGKEDVIIDSFSDICEYLLECPALSMDILLEDTNVFFTLHLADTVGFYVFHTAEEVLDKVDELREANIPRSNQTEMHIMSHETGKVLTSVLSLDEIEYISACFMGSRTPESLRMAELIRDAKVPGNVPVYSTPQSEHSIYAEFLDKDGAMDLPKYFAQKELQVVIRDLEKILENVSDPYIAVSLSAVHERLGVITKELQKK